MFKFRHISNDLNIFIIRHGESQANVDRSCYKEQANRLVELSESGRQQAKKAGEFIKSNLNVDSNNTLLFSSSYVRAHQTAEKIKSFLNIKIYLDDRLVELNYGLFDGLDTRERFELYPEEAKYYYENKALRNEFYSRLPMGESPMDVAIRFQSFWSDVKRNLLEGNSSMENIILVAHSKTNLIIKKTLMNYNVDWYEDEPNPENCSIMKLVFYKNDDFIEDCGYVFIP